jgi:hypothetical protein
LVPLYIRSEAESVKGLKALKSKGAFLWPNPETAGEFEKAIRAPVNALNVKLIQEELPLSPAGKMPEKIAEKNAEPYLAEGSSGLISSSTVSVTPAEELFGKVKEIVLRMQLPKTEAEIVSDLGVAKGQVKDWLRRLVLEGHLEKKGKPPAYHIPSVRQEKLIN